MADQERKLRRVVVTGIGGVTPAGNVHELHPTEDRLIEGSFWPNMLSGRSFVSAVRIGEGTPYASTELGADLTNFDSTLAMYVHGSQLKSTPSFGRYSMVAGLQAGIDSGLVKIVQRATNKLPGSYVLDSNMDPERFAIKIALAVGGDEAIEAAIRALSDGIKVSPRTIPMLNPDKASTSLGSLIGVINPQTGQVDPGQALFLEGDSPTFACTSGAKGPWEVYRDIAYGEADAGLAGGTEDPLHPVPYAGFHRAGLGGVLAKYPDFAEDPTKASQPFDLNRKNLVMGRGAGVMMLEELEHARKRGARIYAELAGGCFRFNPNHTLEPDVASEVRIMKRALKGAGLTPQHLEYINAHAAGTVGDRTEDLAAMELMGNSLNQIWMSSSKSIFGHMMGAAGAVEALATIKALETGIIPPTANLQTPEYAQIEHVAREARERNIIVAASNSFGLDGTYGCLVFIKHPSMLSRAA